MRLSPVLLLLAACVSAPDAVEDVPIPPTVELVNVQFLPLVLQPVEHKLLASDQFEAAADCLREEDWRSAAILLHWLRQEFPHSDEATTLHWFALIKNGEGGANLSRMAQHPSAKTAGGQFALGLAFFMQQQYSPAHQAFSEVLKETPKDFETLHWAAKSAQLAGLNVEAARLLDLIILLPEQGLSREIEVLRAHSLFGTQRWSDAYAQLSRLLDDEQNNDEWWNMSGICVFRIGLQQLRENRGEEHFDSFSRAARCFTEASNIDPQVERYQFNLGCALDWGGDASSAELAYLRAIELQPGYMNAVGNLVELWKLQMRDAEARKLLNAQLRQPLSPQDTSRVRALLLGLGD